MMEDIKTLRCPICHSLLPDEWNEKLEHGFALGFSIAPGTSYIRREPFRSASIEADVGVPALQALISGAFISAAGWVAAGIIHAPNPAMIGAFAGTLSACAIWLLKMEQHYHLLWRVEEIVGEDLDDDGIVGRPTPKPEERLIPVHGAGVEYQGKGDTYLQKQFEEFVRGCEVHGTAQNFWETVRRLPREDYIRFRDVLIRLKWARWRNPAHPNLGWILNAPADEIIARMFRNVCGLSPGEPGQPGGA